jgi:hypothetical protein
MRKAMLPGKTGLVKMPYNGVSPFLAMFVPWKAPIGQDHGKGKGCKGIVYLFSK